MTIEEVAEIFELDKVNRRNAAFDPDKCFWLNGQYVASMSLERFRELCLPVMRAAGLPVGEFSNEYVDHVLASIKEKIKLLRDVPAWTAYFFTDEFAFDEEAVNKTLRAEGAGERLAQLAARLETLGTDALGGGRSGNGVQGAGDRTRREDGGVHPPGARGGERAFGGAEPVPHARHPGQRQGRGPVAQGAGVMRAKEVYTVADLRDWGAATAGVEPPLRLAVFGDPVAHSASPQMHNAALEALGIDARYTRVHVRPEELAEALRLVAAAGFIGVNLTIPHKAAAVPLLDGVDDHAAMLGVVNTVRVAADGALHGSNTDGPGFVRAVRAEFGVELAGASVMILGAGGGAGRALAMQCAMEGCARLFLVNRTVEKAHALADVLRARFPGTHCAVADAPGTLDGMDLVVNASSVGLQAGDVSPIPAEAMPSRLRVFDTVYRRDGESTPLLAAAQAAGARTAGGLSLLLHQGALSFERWFDRPAPLEVMRGALGSP